MVEDLHVCFTMDAERLRAHSPTGGPCDWAFAERSVRTYGDALMAHGYPATFFIVPDTADEQSRLFVEVAGAGHECGMHLHPQCWQDHWQEPDRYDYLGGYGGEEQYGLDSLRATLQALPVIAEETGLTVKSVTLQDLRAAFIAAEHSEVH